MQAFNSFCHLSGEIKFFCWTLGESSQTANLKGKAWEAFSTAFLQNQSRTLHNSIYTICTSAELEGAGT